MSKAKRFGVVVFYDPNYETKTITEISKTPVLPSFEATVVFAETPNPASQIIRFSDTAEMIIELEALEKRVQDREWLDQLFECI